MKEYSVSNGYTLNENNIVLKIIGKYKVLVFVNKKYHGMLSKYNWYASHIEDAGCYLKASIDKNFKIAMNDILKKYPIKYKNDEYVIFDYTNGKVNFDFSEYEQMITRGSRKLKTSDELLSELENMF